jgi:hypothetical protein
MGSGGIGDDLALVRAVSRASSGTSAPRSVVFGRVVCVAATGHGKRAVARSYTAR